MKGVILAGGTGSRLQPLTNVTNKHLLPIYNKPMIYFPLFTLKKAGITSILIVSGKGHAGSFLELLGSGSQFGLNLSYEVQEEAGGIAQALGLARDFVNNEKMVVILGDNVIEDDISGQVSDFENSEKEACLFLKKVNNPQSYGVAKIENEKIVEIIEKPKEFVSNNAVVGLYIYSPTVFEMIDNLKPSARNELEITDVNNIYLKKEKLSHHQLSGFWGDCGESFDSLLEVSEMVKNSHLSNIDNRLNQI